MKISFRKHKYLFCLLLYLSVAVLLVVGIDTSISHAIDKYQEMKLASMSQEQLDDLTTQLQKLNVTVAQLTDSLSNAQELTIPTLVDIRSLSRKSGLAIKRIEFITDDDASGSNSRWYRITFVGPMVKIVRMVHKIETVYLSEIPEFVVVANESSGTEVAAEMKILVASDE